MTTFSIKVLFVIVVTNKATFSMETKKILTNKAIRCKTNVTTVSATNVMTITSSSARGTCSYFLEPTFMRIDLLRNYFGKGG